MSRARRMPIVAAMPNRDPVEARSALSRAAALPRPLVFTNGVFDLLHAGHVDCLEAARELGRSLVVGVNSDRSARALGKGSDRPINGEDERCRVVGALAAVDAVVAFDEPTPLALVELLRPEVYVKGGDYRVEDLPEARCVERWGGRTVILPLRDGCSTTTLIARIRHGGVPA